MAVIKNERIEEFCKLVVRGFKCGEAYEKAGYSPKNPKQAAKYGWRLRATTQVKERIEELRSVLKDIAAAPPPKKEVKALATFIAAQRLSITREFVLRNLYEISQRCMQHSVLLDNEGKPIMVQTADGPVALMCDFQPREALRANELMGKEIGMFVDRHDTTLRVEDRLRQMTDEQRDQHALELHERVQLVLHEADEEDGQVIDVESEDVTPEEDPEE